jgi:hypothetical protein
MTPPRPQPGTPPDARETGPWRLLRAQAGLSLWAVGFAALYAVFSLGCESAWATQPGWLGVSVLSWWLAALWIVLLASLGGLVWRAWRRWQRARDAPLDQRFLGRLTVLLHGAAVLAMFWTGVPILVLPVCI